MDALRSFLIKNDAFLLGRRRLEKTSFFLGSIALCLCLFLAWAAFFHIDRVVRVEGRVIPTGHSRPIQHLEGGIVSAISVKEGQVVKSGDVLIAIDATSAGANLNEGKIKLASQRARAVRLQAETQMQSLLKFPDDLAGQDVSKAETNLFLSRKSKLESDLRVAQETVKQHEAALEEYEQRAKRLAEEIEVAHKRVEMLTAMAARQAASQMELLEAQSREQRLVTERQSSIDAKPKVKAALATERARTASIVADYKTQAQDELVATLAEIDRLAEVTTEAADRVKRTDVRAPIDGTINRISVTTVGAVVKPGETIVELTPLSGEIMVEARVLPKDRGELQPGIEAKVRVTAYDVAALGVLTGLLKDISADTMPDSRGDPYYRAKILIENLPSSYSRRPILPGMTVTSDLVIGQRTILSHLLSPLRKFAHNMFRDSR